MEHPAVIEVSNLHGILKRKLQVLVLDDSDFDRKKIERLIKKADEELDVISCSDLQQFEEALQCQKIDICLVDHQLRGVSGLDAVGLLKRGVDTTQVPVVMISGRDDTETVVQSMKAGCVDYLAKSALTVEKLHSIIFNAISSSISDSELPECVRQATDDVIGGIADGCMKELKPRLSRMYRQIAFLRACQTRGLRASPEALDDIEDQCLTIWRFFDEIDVYSKGMTETHH
jgi:DNA-binding NtrC family response regulator